MSSMVEADDSSGVPDAVRRAVETVRHSVLLSLAVVGLLLILAGYVIHYGVWAAILPTWGVALVLLGTVGYAVIWWRRQ